MRHGGLLVLSVVAVTVGCVSRYRLCPTPVQEAGLLEHCGHARFVWNLAVEQHAWWTPRRGPAPSFAAQCRQLTEARAAFSVAGRRVGDRSAAGAQGLRPGHGELLRRDAPAAGVA
ncbi:helix-turn-helix domain-containing protein [Actinomadura madurae]|uniref:helix-turn-helix domain-containing protein n=1 Tax=Actinomadura madurae TaxID=1993 RepID=UPI003556D8F6